MAAKQKIIVIVGPTAVGKTDLSINLAKKFQGEIISGDSMQVYKNLNIGTAKVTKEEQQGIPHFLLDEIEMTDRYSAGDFQTSARKHIKEIGNRGHLPIIVGGTGLYIQALLFDFTLGGREDNTIEKQAIRRQWEEISETKGKTFVWEHLRQIDPAAADTIHPNNLRRVIRGIEIMETTGKSITEQQGDITDLSASLYDVKLIGLTTDRELLYERINHRVDLMMKEGLEDEARMVFETPDAQSAQGIGYKEFFPYFSGEMSLEEAVTQVKQNSRRYAKRQLTWFRNRMNVSWWDLVQRPEKISELEEELAKWLEQKEEEG
ncbi:tRNA (adenosine(37)-N6)-dimethylallyltransferase MiaA [Vagococcus elongatus]|uniref:tRNA dimethylallyltransferase n=1 Tax=Vagococcus elongatus TaxID=180344 RepID=A0A430ARP4_9ENTE|nr:tRNA (adenosine(37)-N6)-dimethylallyltransferase MiaA [Vagococcus elongatus]RSU10726.1 tRNA (adenosine(37)-N6)-dimethylallyltransferase MiaA [Vagococcus elongatus]